MTEQRIFKGLFILDRIMEVDIWPVIKWILIILLAGFIGQFGKILADEIIGRTRSKAKQDLPSTNDPALPPINTEDNTPMESAIKPPPISDKPSLILDKKIAKAVAKQMKKAAKQ
jgi:hypothetical protein